MNYSMTRTYRPILVAVGLGYIIAREAPRIFAPAEAAGLPANLVHNIQTRTPRLLATRAESTTKRNRLVFGHAGFVVRTMATTGAMTEGQMETLGNQAPGH
jgi:hypothetical protein